MYVPIMLISNQFYTIKIELNFDPKQIDDINKMIKYLMFVLCKISS